MIGGCVGAEIYKVVQGFNDIESYRNNFISLALPLIMSTEPSPILKNMSSEYDRKLFGPAKAIPEGFTHYDKIVVQGPLTI